MTETPSHTLEKPPTPLTLINMSGTPHPSIFHLVSEKGLQLPSEEMVTHGSGQTRHRMTHSLLEFHPGCSVHVYQCGNLFFFAPVNVDGAPNIWMFDVEELASAPCRVEVLGDAYHKQITWIEWHSNNYWNRTSSERTGLAWYMPDPHDHDNTESKRILWDYIKVRVTLDNGASEEMEWRFGRPDAGVLDLGIDGQTTYQVTYERFGLKHTWAEYLYKTESRYSAPTRWEQAWRLLKNFEIKQGRDELWRRFFASISPLAIFSKGVASMENRKDIKPVLARLKAEEPLLFTYYTWLHGERTQEGFPNNSLLAAFLSVHGTSFDAMKQHLTESMEFARLGEQPSYNSDWHARPYCLELPGAKDKQEEKRSKKEWYLHKTQKAQALGIGVSETAHRKLLAAIERGDIPMSVFHTAQDKLQPINVEFDLWEAAFERPGWEEILCSIAQNAGGRTTYSKAITPYIAFLFRIEGYLDRHTGRGKKWKAKPKFVQSEWELEMSEDAAETTSKRRSALTPIIDNENRTIEVPYVAMRISGVRTTYCYSNDYQVFESHTIDRQSGTPIVYELEEKLNGRDDYGLMYYTLDGSPTNTGYPAFLMIFERRQKTGTFVHAHRVHPCRSKDGKTTPASRLIQECYRYMAGNIRAEEIFAQQGDLIFIKTDQKVEMGETRVVKEFESHKFERLAEGEIFVIPNEAKSIKNRLGFILCNTYFAVTHPEHDALPMMPPGLYEVRRCKSYENNPKGVWVLSID